MKSHMNQKNKLPRRAVLALAIASGFAAQAAFAQTAATGSNTVVVTGTRVANRTVLDTTSPVDVISSEALTNSGTTEINQALSVALPSLNFPRPSLTDGTDTIRPVTLRGLAPDQSLVLVNSKRRHTASLVNINGSVGRGSAAVDLNTIPTSIVNSIEVLRDGASAQYGSDAISGVINVRLRTDRTGGEGTLSYGVRKTTYDYIAGTVPTGANWSVPSSTSRDRTDGQTGTISLWKGLSLGADGFLTVAAEYKNAAHTERSGYDVRQQYPLVGTAFDPREATINRFNAWYGEPEIKQATLFANAGINLGGDLKLYGWSSYQNRLSKSPGFFRRPLQDQNILSIYPDGFLPFISPTVDDFSLAGGATWTAGDWGMDASVTYGKNKMAYQIDNTLNRSIGPSSKTSFDAGGFSYDQTTVNLSGVRAVNVSGLFAPVNIALGAEVRKEGYNIFAGEPDSYRNGGALLANGSPTPSGSQVFPGFRDVNVSSNGRTAAGAYVDLETNLSKDFLASAAARSEHYSDFGNNTTGKLALRYDFIKEFALRGSVQNGFRAPSPQQQFFTTTSTNFINGVPFEITTFRPSDAAAVALGAKPLKPEKSTNLSLGAVMRVGGLNVTIDGYQIKLTDRIVLSENLTATNVRTYLTSLGFIGIGGGRFFINGVDTTTKGVDIVAAWSMMTQDAGKFDFTLAGNANKTTVDRVPTTAQLTALNPAPDLFARNNILTFERGQPKNKLSASVVWNMGPAGATLRATRYGEVLSPGTTAATDFLIDPATLVDVEGRYKFGPQWTLAGGVENLLDKYPTPLPAALNTTGNTPYSNLAPFGRSGRFLYARVSYKF